MARIKVLQIVEASLGGVLRHVVQIAERLDMTRFDLTVAVSPKRMANAERGIARLRSLGVRVETVPMERRIAPAADLAALWHLVRLMRRGRYDVVHAHSSKAGFLGRLAARVAGVRRVFYSPHAFAFQQGGVAGWFYKQLERLAARFGGVILAVSESEGSLAVRGRIAGSERVRVIRNAVEPAGAIEPAERSAVRTALGLPQDVCVVGTVGRLAYQKGCEWLIRAAALVERDRGRGVRFLVVGSGQIESRLKSMAAQLGVADIVLFAGERDDARSLYAAMDVYVQPSLWEGLPYALLDAMARSLPVIATEVPGNADVVRTRATGLLVPARDASVIASAIIELLDDANLGRALGEAARELILREHNLDDFIGSIEAIYSGDA